MRIRFVHEVKELLTFAPVVTGASEGIGKEFSLQLAKKGFNVLVSARNAAALDALVAEIGEAPSCSTCVCAGA